MLMAHFCNHLLNDVIVVRKEQLEQLSFKEAKEASWMCFGSLCSDSRAWEDKKI